MSKKAIKGKSLKIWEVTIKCRCSEIAKCLCSWKSRKKNGRNSKSGFLKHLFNQPILVY